MDWSKAKTILIVALIVTNLLLGYVLYRGEFIVDETINKDFIEDAIVLLKNKDIKIATDIPTIVPSLSSLKVEYEWLNKDILNKNFFDGDGIIRSKNDELLEIFNEDEILTIINNKLLIYESKSSVPKYNIKSEKEAIELANDFLFDRKIDISDMKLSFIKQVDGVYNLEFTKVFDDNYIESTFTNLQLDNTGVKKLERNWLNMKEIGLKSLMIGSAPKSILNLISMEEAYGKTIKDISLCYFFNPQGHDYVENPDEARQGTTIPAWRVQFEDGYKIFIDNY